MDEQSTDKFTWVIENFSELKRKTYSPQFVAGCCYWRLLVFPKGNKVDHLSVYLDVVNPGSLPSQWRRHARFTISVVNQFTNRQALIKQSIHWFNAREIDWGFTKFMTLDELKNPKNGFLLNNKLIVEADVEVLEVQGNLDILEKPIQTAGNSFVESPREVDASTGNSKQFTSSPLVDAVKVEICKRFASVENPQELLEVYETMETDEAKSNDAAIVAASNSELKSQTVDVNGFLVHEKQVEQVKRIFEKHPDMASNFHPKNQQIRATYMNVLLGLIEAFCRSPQDITEDDLSKGLNTLIDLEDAGFKLDWLRANFDEVWKRNKRAGGSRIRELEKQFDKLKLMMSDLEAALVKEKEEIAAVKVPLSFNDLVSKLC